MDLNQPESPNHVPYKKALMALLLSTLMISGTAALGLFYYMHVRSQYAHDDTYRIEAVVQASNDPEGLKTAYLTELLDLSVDHPSNLYRFNTTEARKKLLASPLIKEAQIKKVRPGILYVDYTMRIPKAFLLDYTNTVVDGESVPFPFKPFFTPKRLPEIYLGIAQQLDSSPLFGGEWGIPLKGQRIQLAQDVLDHITDNYLSENTSVLRVDVSKAYSPSCGQRQIIVIIEEKAVHSNDQQTVLLRFNHILRLETENYAQGIANYFTMQSQLLEKYGKIPAENQLSVLDIPSTVIDLRIPSLAYIQQ